MPRPRATEPKFSLARRDGRYCVEWWEDGRARRVSCRTIHVAEARQFLAAFRAARSTPVPPEAPTIGAILDGYEAERWPLVHSPTLRYSCQALRRHLGDLSAALLTKQVVGRYVASRRKEGRRHASTRHLASQPPLSDGTVVRELVQLRAALKWAVREKWITEAPYVPMPAAPPPRDRWLTLDDAHRLLDCCRQPHVRMFAALALYTGARTSALLELRWDQVRLDARLIDLGHGRGNKKRAKVPISDGLGAELRKALEVRTSDFVVEHGGERIRSVKTGFRAACQRAGLADVTPHVLRHTAATLMVQGGVSLEQVAAFLGNSKEIIERVYGHHSPEWLRPAAQALERRPGPVSSPSGEEIRHRGSAK